jgi:branched-chain amino acid transport system permease protein
MLDATSPFRHAWRRHRSLVVQAALLCVVTVALTKLGGEQAQTTLTEMLIRVTVVLGLSIFISNSGVISFGHIGFMCIGAYVVAWAMAEPVFKQMMLQGLPDYVQTHQFDPAIALLGATLLSAIVALILGLAIMRLSGIAASIATFAFLMIINSIYSNWDSVTAGASSIIGIPVTVGPWIGLGFSLVSLLVAYCFQVSRYGLMLRAVREDEVAARASGVNVLRARVIAFVLSAAVVGLGGGLYAQFLGILTVDAFYLNLTFITVAMLVVGGLNRFGGAVAGVLAVTLIVQILRALEAGVDLGALHVVIPPGSQEIGLGVLIGLILVFKPEGLVGGWRD